MKSTLITIFAAIAVSCLGAGVALSQNITASIAGVAKDPSGAAVPNITVTATNDGTSARFQATTDGDGQYTIRAVPIGVYQLIAEAPGF